MKSTVGSVVAISFGLAISAYASMSRLSIERESFEGGVRGPSDETARYVTVDLPYDPFRRLTESLETLEGIKLKTRGEAHITLITPPEFDVLSKHLAESEIRHAFDAVALRPAEPICVGRGHVGAAKTYYVVVKLASALKVRELLAKKFKARGGDLAQFKAAVFYPHVTLGFTDRDLHIQDGVVKDAKSCVHRFAP
ncbi:MAG: hypothetical protein JNJ49_05035 [Bdellovibrionaceae bacterium]|nr:hypothetical protein [Pseudobdellovibrionaceae bacterium]